MVFTQDMSTNGTHTIDIRGGERRGSGHSYQGEGSSIAVIDPNGTVVATYERTKNGYRAPVESRCQFRLPAADDKGRWWETVTTIPAGSDARNLRAWFLTEIADRYNV